MVKTDLLIIAGMHRSGTSLVTRLCNLLGYRLGDNLVPAKAGDNDTGYWEEEALVRLHEEAYGVYHMRSDDIDLLPSDLVNAKELSSVRQKIADFLRTQLVGQVRYAIKDPRVCRFLSLWLRACGVQAIPPRVLIPFRHPLAVAASILKRDTDYYTEEGIVLWWLLHVLEAERASRTVPRAFVSYDDVLNDWQGQMMSVASQWDVEWPVAVEDISEDVERFIQPALKHHAPSWDDAQGQGQIYIWAKEVYAWLDEAHSNKVRDTEKSDTILREIHANYRPFQRTLTRVRGALAHVESELAGAHSEYALLKGRVGWQDERIMDLEKEMAQLHADLAARTAERDTAEGRIMGMEQSTSWRITAPIRKLKSAVSGSAESGQDGCSETVASTEASPPDEHNTTR